MPAKQLLYAALLFSCSIDPNAWQDLKSAGDTNESAYPCLGGSSGDHVIISYTDPKGAAPSHMLRRNLFILDKAFSSDSETKLLRNENNCVPVIVELSHDCQARNEVTCPATSRLSSESIEVDLNSGTGRSTVCDWNDCYELNVTIDIEET